MIVSSIHGRIRFSDENIKRSETADKINKSLESLEGIENIRINGVIGSLLVNYDEEKTNLVEITNLLKKYIDIDYEPREIQPQKYNYIDKAIEVVKNEMGNQKQRTGKGKQGSNKGNLMDMGMENLTGSGIMKFALYSVLGVQGYKKGKGIIQGKGGKNSR